MVHCFIHEREQFRLREQARQIKDLMLGASCGTDLRGDLAMQYSKALVAYDNHMMRRAYELLNRTEALASEWFERVHAPVGLSNRPENAD